MAFRQELVPANSCQGLNWSEIRWIQQPCQGPQGCSDPHRCRRLPSWRKNFYVATSRCSWNRFH